MKCILLVRHAKSSWDSATLSDFDRPLNERGKKDAPVMAARVLARGVSIDAYVSSPARRARKTAELFAGETGAHKKDIIFIDSLYHPQHSAFEAAISGMDDHLQCVAIFSHNPGITDFANSLGTVRTDDMPTCAVFAVKADINSWKDFAAAKKEYWFYDYPKAIE